MDKKLNFKTRTAARNDTSEILKIYGSVADRVAELKLRLRLNRVGTTRPLKRPVVQGTMMLGGWSVTLENPYALGQVARMSQVESIKFLPSYVNWEVTVEDVFDEELRATLETEDAEFIAEVRNGYLATLHACCGSRRGAK